MRRGHPASQDTKKKGGASRPSLVPPKMQGAQCARIASSSSATMLVILITGLTAGPAVSL